MADPRRAPSLWWFALLGGVLILCLAVIVAVALGFMRVATLPDFGSIQRNVWYLVSFSAALGALAMVLVQVTRQLVPFRGEFHRKQLTSFLGGSEAPNISDALGEISGRGLSDDAFDMPLEQLAGQLAAAADRVVAEPKETPSLAFALAGPKGLPHLRVLLDLDTRSDLDRLAAQQALTRIIQGRIDRFQIETGTRWRRRLRTTVLQVTLFFGGVIALSGALQPGGIGARIGFVLYGALGSIMAAFFAMLFRDLTALAERRRL